VHDEREFVLNLSESEQHALHSNRVPSSISRGLPPVHSPRRGVSPGEGQTMSVGRGAGPRTSSAAMIKPQKSSDAAEGHRRTSRSYIADHRRGSAGHA
jgi:hypothetical protein